VDQLAGRSRESQNHPKAAVLMFAALGRDAIVSRLARIHCVTPQT
jgi:hypothetical protein